jgi:hypothetical protein
VENAPDEPLANNKSITMKWITLQPKPQRRRKAKPLDLPPRPPPTEEEKLEPMRWQIDPTSEAADALRLLRKKMVG